MRGNELLVLKALAVEALGFQIPMRGNEAADAIDNVFSFLKVSNPHEG